MSLNLSSDADFLPSGRMSARRQMFLLAALVGVLALLLISLLTGVSANTEFLDRYFVWLYAANIVVGITLLLVIISLAVTLAIRWRQGYFGTKLIVKLAMIFGLVGVLPGAILYSVSLQFVSRSIESWFDVKVESALDAGLQLGRLALESELNKFALSGSNLLADLSDSGEINAAQWSKFCKISASDQISISDAEGRLKVKHRCDGSLFVDEITSYEQFQQAQRTGRNAFVEDVTNSLNADNFRLTAIYRLNSVEYLRISRMLTGTQNDNIRKVQQAYSGYQEKALGRLGLRKMYIGSLTLTMFLALFIAVALALILGRQLALPLLMLLRGTQAVAQGDLSPKPEINTGDELGLLTRQFNMMTKQLADARESLQESKDFSESILVNLTAGVCVLDANFKLLIANSGAKRILERDVTPLLGKSLGTIPELAHFDEMVREAFRVNTVPVGRDDSSLSSAGTTSQTSWQRQIELYPSPDSDENNSSQTLLARGTKLASGQHIIVFDDITDVITAQRSVAWGEVARRLAHEIKNPLTPIQLSAERIFQKLTGKVPQDQEDFIAKSTKTIVNQVQAMKQMVNDFRDFARTPTPVLVPVNLNNLVKEVLGLYEGSKIHLNLDESCPKILGDATQLRQVMHNLLQNAIDASLENQGPQEIEVGTETISYEGTQGQEEQMVRITVSDSGHGFSPRILSRAFEPYITTKSKGTGLGLAVVKKIIDEHGARIELKNREKNGVIIGAKISILFNKLVHEE